MLLIVDCFLLLLCVGGSARSYRVSDFQEVKEFARQSLEHADLCLDSAGDDVLMMMGSMNSYRLRDGKVVNQVKRATAAGLKYF